LVEGLTKLFQDHVWKLHGLPENIILDREIQFAVKMMKELNNLLEIRQNSRQPITLKQMGR